ncbi:MAG TPA: hypothetical protein VI386_22815 [Candidatus Sulfotelmatobacter sp.]
MIRNRRSPKQRQRLTTRKRLLLGPLMRPPRQSRWPRGYLPIPDKKSTATTDCKAAQKALDAATQSSNDADQQAQVASKAVGDAVTGSADSAKSAAATTVFKARDAAKQLAQVAQVTSSFSSETPFQTI